jgi:hypothetical protein
LGDLEDLQARADVAENLFKRGATRVKITGADIEIDWNVWRAYEAATGQSPIGPVSQNVQVNVSASASSAASISNSIRQIVRELGQLGIDAAKMPEAKEKLKTLEEELRKERPHWNIVKQVLHWALDLSRELFLRLAVLITERYVASKL